MKIPFSSYDFMNRTNLYTAYYHMVSNEEVPHIKHLYPHKTIKQFEDDLDYILKYLYPISLPDLLANKQKGIVLRDMVFLMTFDDGFREMHDIVAPILLRKGIPATFFINSAFTDNRVLCYQHKASIIIKHLLQNCSSTSFLKQIDKFPSFKNKKQSEIANIILSTKYSQRNMIDDVAQAFDIDFSSYLKKIKPYLTTQQIEDLIKKGFTIGAHSIDHPLYSDISIQDQIYQTIESMRFVKNTFKLNYGAFAFPHSDLGVSKTYFDEIKKTGLVDISFGTAGLIEDCVENNIQRFSLEKPLLPAKNIFSMHAAKRLWNILRRKDKITRQLALR